MQQATTVVSYVSESRFSAPGRRDVISSQRVRNCLAGLEGIVRGTISLDSRMGGLSCLIELSQ